MILSLVLGMVLVFLVLLQFVQFFGQFSGTTPGGQSGRWLEEVVVEDNHSRNRIAIIDVEGIITSQAWDRSGRNMVDLIEDQLKLAARDKSIKAVVLKVDSPGGEVMASDDISRALLQFQEEHRKPVVAAMGGMAASGGYYVAVPCQWIVANDLTITGSIGVIMNTLNYRGLMDKVGLYPQVYKSGRFKDMLRGSKKLDEIDPEEGRMIQSMIDETYARFKTVVAKGRERAKELNKGEGRALVADWEQYADGRVLTGKQAFEHGFVDEKGNFDTAVQRAKKLAGIDDANLIRYREPFSLFNLFSLLGKAHADSRTIRLDVGFDLPRLEPGRLYFLSPTVVH